MALRDCAWAVPLQSLCFAGSTLPVLRNLQPFVLPDYEPVNPREEDISTVPIPDFIRFTMAREKLVPAVQTLAKVVVGGQYIGRNKQVAGGGSRVLSAGEHELPATQQHVTITIANIRDAAAAADEDAGHRRTRTYHCSICGATGHNRRRCPSQDVATEPFDECESDEDDDDEDENDGAGDDSGAGAVGDDNDPDYEGE